VAGVSGLALGAGLIWIMGGLRGTAARIEFLIPSIQFSGELAAVAFVVLVGVGIAAGIAPALRAARLDPAVALRDE
jgi:ABC-type antimicrobial peptide transport system permease subunit